MLVDGRNVASRSEKMQRTYRSRHVVNRGFGNLAAGLTAHRHIQFPVGVKPRFPAYDLLSLRREILLTNVNVQGLTSQEPSGRN